MTGAAKNTVAKLLLEPGEACREYQDRVLRDLTCQRVQCDEVWSFVACKQKNIRQERRGEFGIGDVWTWTAMDADTKLMICWLVGEREARDAYDFVCELSSRLSNRVQLTTDGHSVYLNAVERAFGSDIDYAMLVKVYGTTEESEKRYSPPVCLAANPTRISGRPNPRHISTSFVERQNLTLRMGLRRFTRLTNAFSKKLENHACAVALHFMYYNFARIHQTLGTTPAVAAEVADHAWSVEEIVGLLGSN